MFYTKMSSVLNCFQYNGTLDVFFKVVREAGAYWLLMRNYIFMLSLIYNSRVYCKAIQLHFQPPHFSDLSDFKLFFETISRKDLLDCGEAQTQA